MVSAAAAPAADGVDYLRDVKPIFAQKCFACHGALKQESGLRLDAAQMVRKGGDSGPAIVPGKAAESLLVQRVSTADIDSRMPLEGEGEPLDQRQLAIVRAWIDQGAVAPDESVPADPREHWAFRSPVRSVIPQINRAHWVQSPIDGFIAHEHDRMG